MFACVYLPPSPKFRQASAVTKLRLEPPSDEPASQDGEPSLLGGRSAAAAKTASKAEGTKTCFIHEDIGFRRCLGAKGASGAPLIDLARDFSPRIETHGERIVTLDIRGLGSLLGDARTIGEELRRTAADRGLRVHLAIAATRTAAIVLAQARAGLTVIPPGEEAAALAPLPLSALAGLRGICETCGEDVSHKSPATHESAVAQFQHWGLRTPVSYTHLTLPTTPYV